MSVSIDPQAFGVRIEALTLAYDLSPFDSTAWIASLVNGPRTIAEYGLLQALRPDVNLPAAADDLFGRAAVDGATHVMEHVRIGSGDIVLAQVEHYEQAPDTPTLDAYALLRVMCSLRAAVLHAPAPLLTDQTLEHLDATRWRLGSTVHIESALRSHDHLLDTITNTHRGLRLAGA